MLRNTNKRLNLMCAGTFGVTSKESMTQMIAAGYRQFDLASAYKESHQLMAEALQGRDRSEFRLCTKFNDVDLLGNDFSVRSIAAKILGELKTSYIDIFMMHNPAVLLHARAIEVMEELIKLKNENVIRSIGVSNFTVEDLQRLDPAYLKQISYIQVEIHPYCQQTNLLKFCESNDIKTMGYRPFGKGKAEDMLENSVLKTIAEQHAVSVHHVILAWLMQKNIIAIAKAANINHLVSNMAACALKLSPENMQAITKLDKNLHTCSWEGFVKIPDFKAYMNKPLIKPIQSSGRLGMYAAQQDSEARNEAFASQVGKKL